MNTKRIIPTLTILVFIILIGCSDEDPTSVEVESIMIRLSVHSSRIDEKESWEESFLYRLNEGDEFYVEPYEGEFCFFKLVDVIDPLHAEIQYICYFVTPMLGGSDSCTVVVGLEEVWFGHNVCSVDCDSYRMRVSIGGF